MTSLSDPSPPACRSGARHRNGLRPAIVGAALLAIAMLAAGCGGDPDDSAGGADNDTGVTDCPIGALADADGPVEVTVWSTLVGNPVLTLEALIDDYNNSQDVVVVRHQNQGVAYEELQRQFNTGIRSGELPGLAVLADVQTQFLADSGVIVAGQACFDADPDADIDDFLPLARSTYSVDGALQPVGVNLSTAVQYFNRDHFTEAGLDPDDPPGTLAELRVAAEAIRDAGVSDTPLVMVAAPSFIEHWLTGNGAAIVNNNNGRDGLATEATYDNPTTIELYQWLADMNADGLLQAVPATEGQIDHLFAMALQQSSITFETSTAISTVNSVLEGTLSADDIAVEGIDVSNLPPIDINVDVAPFPGMTAPGQVQVGGGAFYIPNTNTPEVIAAAWDFMKWFNTTAVQVEWGVGSSYLPSNTNTANDPETREYWSDTRPGQWTATAFSQVAERNPDDPGPLIGPFIDMRDAIRRSLDDLLLGQASPQQAASDANAQITVTLERYAQENF